MRKLLLLSFTLMLLTLSKNGFAVDYHLIPDSNAAWQIRYWNGPGYPYFYYYYYMNPTKNDTIINGNTYAKLYAMGWTADSSYVGALREVNSAQVYFYPKDSLSEYLLFDFSKNAGDSVFFYSMGFLGLPLEKFAAKVESKDSILLANKYQRHIQFHSSNLEWTEGIGSNWGLLEIGTLVSGQTFLICMSKDDTTWTQSNYALGACSLILEGVTEHLPDNYFSIYPNPTQSHFTVALESTHASYSLEIYTLFGERIYSEVFKQKERMINISNISEGIYLVKVRTQEGEYYKKLIIQRD